MTLRETLRWGEDYLQNKNVPEAKLNAWYLFASVFGLSKSEFFLKEKEEADAVSKECFERYIRRRAEREPLEYITGETEFMGLRFFVTPDVLIPRQDTECLIEQLLPVVKGKKVLDLCTGSGCIGISLAKLGDCMEVTLSDVSKKALAVAEKNAKENKTPVTLIQGDLFENVSGSYDVIVSNPPYIKTDVIATLMPEVREYEPHLALDGKADGMFFYRRIIKESPKYLEKGGILALEIGYDQAEEVSREMRQAGFRNVFVSQDLAGLDRIVTGKIG